MSYLKRMEYNLVLQESFSVIRNCSGCGRKTNYKNTKMFRVNANGKRLDVWLIYQCENCKHTFNLAVYERRKVSSISEKEYKCFLNNDEELAIRYGRTISLFQKNKAEINDKQISYQFIKVQETTDTNHCSDQTLLIIKNPYCLKIRPEKQIAEILGLSRSQLKKWIDQGAINIDSISLQSVSVYVNLSVLNIDLHGTE